MPSRRDRHRFGTAGEDHDGQRAVEEGDGRGEKTRVQYPISSVKTQCSGSGWIRSIVDLGWRSDYEISETLEL